MGADAVAEDLLPEVATLLSHAHVQKVLEEIQGWGSEGAGMDLFLLYLKELCAAGTAAEIRALLVNMKLPSSAGSWQHSGKLLAGVSGVSSDRTIDPRVADILGSFILTNSNAPANAPEVRSEYAPWYQADLANSVATAFDPLRDCNAQGAVGVVIGLFGAATHDLTRTWIGDISYEDFLAKLGWKDPGYKKGSLDSLDWMGGKTVEEALTALRPTLEIVTGHTVNVLSILGNEVEVELLPTEETLSLFAGAVSWKGGYHCVIPLRPPHLLLEMDMIRQKEILRRTAEDLLIELYNQRGAELGALWALFENADQVTLAIARGMILDGLPQSLRQLGSARKNGKISEAVDQVDAARRDVESARHTQGNVAHHQASKEQALVALAQLVEGDAEVQAALLEGIRQRVAQNQYEIDSIPFEMLQNADDAVSEFQQMQDADGRERMDSRLIGRFIVESGQGTVRFMHWGRPVNYTGRRSSYRSDYANDLERMLMLGASSKSNMEDVTGKFGLGFKSVLLAAARPRVWSGDLSFEIVAGCLPQPWIGGPETRAFHATYQAPGTRALRSTLVELPLDHPPDALDVIRRFAALAGVLTVFSRNIKQIVVDGHQHSWTPKILQEDLRSSVELGSIQLPTGSGTLISRMLILRAKSGAIGLRVDATGVIPFDPIAAPAVPAVWVTAPTRGTAARGVIINASFHIDTGRGSLALGKTAELNLKLVRSIADELTDVLVALQLRSEFDWITVSDQLGCSQQETPADFWFGFWKVLFAQSPPQDAAEDVLLIEGFVGRLFQRVVSRTGKIPAGIAGAGLGLVPLHELSLAVKVDRLGGLVPLLRGWPDFVERHPVAGWCAEDVPDWVKRSGLQDDLSTISRLDPALVIGSIPGARLGPDQIANLAAVIHAWPRGALEDNAWAGLGALMLRSVAGSWAPAKTLLHDGDIEHRLLFRFAPACARLESSYGSQATAWQEVRQYLPPFRVDHETLAGWCQSASLRDAQVGVLDFLVHSPYHPVIKIVVNQNRFAPSWISDLSAEHELFREFPVEDVRSLLAKLGLADVEESRDEGRDSPALDLPAIWGWWDEHRDILLPAYEAKLWPAQVDPTFLSVEPFDRTAWMTLFSLAIFRRYGRANDEQHRGFLDFLHSKGWWDVICDVRPDVEPAAWMGILKEYAERQMTTPLFEQWMDSFPRLYRVARWLDDYVHLFQTLDLRRDDEVAELLTPAGDASLNGSEIDAPTLSGMLRLGRHLVVRELLRARVLNSELAERLAYMPRRSVLALMSDMGYPDLTSSQQIHEILVAELGADLARFHGDYDIPLQLLATDESLRYEVAAWKSRTWTDVDEDEVVEEIYG